MGVKKLELFRTLLQTTCVIFVVGCGGGGGTSPAVGLQPLNPTPPPSPTYPHTMPGSDIGYNTEPDVGITDAVALKLTFITLNPAFFLKHFYISHSTFSFLELDLQSAIHL